MKVVFAAIFVMIAGAAADNCAGMATSFKVGPHTMKADLTGLVCKGDDMSGSNCGECCQATPGYCYVLAGAGKEKCDSKMYADEAKYAVAATKATFKTACCTKKALCGSFTCGAGMKAKANNTNMMCAKSPCTNKDGDQNICCDADTTTCAGSNLVPRVCGSGKSYDSTKAAVVSKADGTDYVAKCCMTSANCTTFTCPANYEASKPAPKCKGSTCNEMSDKDICCGVKKGTCESVGRTPGTSCDSNLFADSAKFAVTATTADFKTKCCTKKSTCTEFSTAAIAGFGTASFANTQHGSAMLLLALVGASLALGK